LHTKLDVGAPVQTLADHHQLFVVYIKHGKQPLGERHRTPPCV